MVARIITGKSIRGALRYNEQKVLEGKAELLLAHRFLQEPETLRWEDKLQRFARLTEKNPRVRTNCVHISLNFAMGENLPGQTLQAIATEYMARLDFGGQPYLVYRHTDAAHPHLHIVTTNLQPDGSRIPLHNLGRYRSEPARKALELRYGLTQAEGQQETPLEALLRLPLSRARYGKSETRRSIAHIVSVVTRTYSYTSLAELNAVLGSFRVRADRGGEQTQMHRRGGLHYRLLDDSGQPVGVPLKASSLPGKPTLATLERRFAQHKQLRKPLRNKLRQRVAEALQAYRPHDRTSLAACLERAQIQVLFREGAGGRVYGVTFLDHGQRAVFNGSELGKAYSAQALLDRLKATTPPIPAPRQEARPSPAPGPVSTASQESPPGQGLSAPSLLQELLQASPEPAYLPYELSKRRKRRKRRRPGL
ncbi:relaxase/mobilization nuclease-like protein [Pontibacter mucosus]|uniref:Relaxase/mobilization nuclease-like protein n=1 Tax=Pontibacter mucosus TaxID=1649266 RepID=A0A2T5YEE7_9BACT|nr:relaxase/mobilization nuclease domain-containing protein [Pontibacter mucosus]PTX15090.1 relaxase/mobilization nuclease-like protein [Pontibacter mucosus]